MNRPIYYRERSSNMYHRLMPIITGLINEIPWTLLDSIFFVNIIYWMLDFRLDAGAYFAYLFSCFFFSYIYVTIAALLSSISPSFAVAQVIEEMMYNTMSSTQGINIRKSMIPSGYKWLFEALATSHFSHMIVDTQFSDSYEIVTVLEGTVTKSMPFRDYVVFYTSFNYGEFWMQLLYAALFFIAIVVATLTTNYFIKFSTR